MTRRLQVSVLVSKSELHACTAQEYRSRIHERDLRKSGAGRYLVLSGGLAARRRPRQGVRAGLNSRAGLLGLCPSKEDSRVVVSRQFPCEAKGVLNVII